MRAIERLLWLVRARTAPKGLAFARVVIGIASLVQVVDSTVFLRRILSPASLRFPYEAFTAPMTADALPLFAVVSIVSTVSFAIGWRTRTAASVSAACLLYGIFIDQQSYSNHQFLLSLCVLIVGVGGGGSAFGLDARHRVGSTAAYWAVFVLKAQLSIVYAFAALSKVNGAYLSGLVLVYTLRDSGPLAFPWLRTPAVLAAIAAGSILLELFLAFGFWVRRWRRLAVIAGVIFHLGLIALMRSYETLQLVVFALSMMAMYRLFFEPPIDATDRPDTHGSPAGLRETSQSLDDDQLELLSKALARVRRRVGQSQSGRFQYELALVLALLLAIGQVTSAQTPAAELKNLVTAGQTALAEERFGDAFAAFARAAKLSPRDASLMAAAGYAAARVGRLAEAAQWLERALTLQPSLTSASTALAQVLHAQGNVRQAMAVVEAALLHASRDKMLLSMRERWRDEARRDERMFEARGAHFTVLFEGPADDRAGRRVVDILEQAYLRIGGMLSIYPPEPVTVVLFTGEQFRDITRSPGWAGGLYDGRIKIPMIGALDRSDDLRRILEHEYVHAVIASLAGPSVPAWLNEGLAAALEPGDLTWAADTLRATPERHAYAALAQSFGRFGGGDAAIAYAQSALTVKRLLDLRGAAAMVSLLESLGRGTPFDVAFHASMLLRVDELQTLIGRL